MGTLIQHASEHLSGEMTLAEELDEGLSAWEVVRRLAHLPHLLYLDSAQNSPLGRYSFIAADPFAFLTAASNDPDPFPALRKLLKEYPNPTLPDLPPFQGGAAGLFGFGLAHHLERLPRPRYDDFQVPDLAIGMYDWVVAFDHHQERSWIVSTGYPEKTRQARKRRAHDRLDGVRALLRQEAQTLSWNAGTAIRLSTPTQPTERGLFSNFSRSQYLEAVARAIEYVHAGDCFQVNIAQRLLTPSTCHPLELYSRLRARNPAPFAGYFDLGDFTLASASPERFLRLDRGKVETRPIKGTRRRKAHAGEDEKLAQELLTSAKDRAENVMIVDLLRNDLGRVCQYGSVEVEALCRLESYEFVHHLVSVVTGQLRPGLDAVDLLRATFPGGSVTGAPKIRSLEIIAELEQVARGPYCGCLGFLGFDGAMDTNILIRTFVQGKGWTYASVGGGIVADSTPEREFDETWTKAEGLLRAL